MIGGNGMITKEAIIEMLHKINGKNGITRTKDEIRALADDLFNCKENNSK